MLKVNYIKKGDKIYYSAGLTPLMYMKFYSSSESDEISTGATDECNFITIKFVDEESKNAFSQVKYYETTFNIP